MDGKKERFRFECLEVPTVMVELMAKTVNRLRNMVVKQLNCAKQVRLRPLRAGAVSRHCILKRHSRKLTLNAVYCGGEHFARTLLGNVTRQLSFLRGRDAVASRK